MALTVAELQHFVPSIEKSLVGAQLQDVWTNGEILVLEFYLKRSYWLCFDLQPQNPDLALLTERPRIAKTPKPTSLFLAAHGKNLRLKDFLVDVVRGRVLVLDLMGVSEGVSRNCRCECYLIPKNVNFQIHSQGKSLSWSKPRELPPQVSQAPEQTQNLAKDWVEHSNQWALRRWGGAPSAHAKSASPDEARKSFAKIIEKKQKAIDGILKQQQEDAITRYFALGEILKSTDEVPEAFKDLYSSKLSRSQNRENCFQKAKSLKRKIQGTGDRLQQLQDEVQRMKMSLEDGSWQSSLGSPKVSESSAVLKKAEAKTRKLQLSEGFEVVMGKSAKDNIAILRQARPWDLWFHLRDFPSAHAILFRQKNQVVSESVFVKVGEWLVKESLSKKQLTSGTKYSAVVAECRFVRPVKGTVGLVTFQNEKSFSFASK